VAIYVQTSTVVVGCFALVHIFVVTVVWFVGTKNGSDSRFQHSRTVMMDPEPTSET
jgi:hypothetical protein